MTAINSRPVLVTGAAGFIGAALCQRLLQRGDRVIGIDNLNSYYDPALKQARLEAIELDRLKTCLFEGGVVIAVEVVDADHAITALQQPLAESSPNETGSTGHQNRSGVDGSHGRSANSGKQIDVMRISA